MEPLRYPVGAFETLGNLSSADVNAHVQAIEERPSQVPESVNGLHDVQLDAPSREGGRALREVLHHLANRYRNHYARIRFVLTEENPSIMPSDETEWAELPEARSGGLENWSNVLEGSSRALGGIAALLGTSTGRTPETCLYNAPSGEWSRSTQPWPRKRGMANTTSRISES